MAGGTSFILIFSEHLISYTFSFPSSLKWHPLNNITASLEFSKELLMFYFCPLCLLLDFAPYTVHFYATPDRTGVSVFPYCFIALKTYISINESVLRPCTLFCLLFIYLSLCLHRMCLCTIGYDLIHINSRECRKPEKLCNHIMQNYV